MPKNYPDLVEAEWLSDRDLKKGALEDKKANSKAASKLKGLGKFKNEEKE
jgi:hypothetical protein